MKAVRYHAHGGSDVLRHEDVEQPVPGAGQVLVKVAATSFNPVDDHIRVGALAEMIPVALPHVPGSDLAGTVAEMGAGVEGFTVGDPVVALLPFDVTGASAEYVLAPAEALVRAPATLELVDAAALPLVGLAAYQALFELAGLRPNQTVLITGAGGAVGGMAVQLAVDAGAVVTASADARHAGRLKGYGADRIVGRLDLDEGPESIGGPFDVVLNLLHTSPEETAKLSGYVADGGFAASTGTPVPEDSARSVRSAWLFVRSDAALLAGLVEKVDAGRIRPHVADRRPLAELGAVHEDAGAGRLPGKTVITTP